jgi:hypothetical protein
MDIFAGYAEVGQQMQPYQGRNDVIPMPARFDQGTALMLAIMDPQAQPQTVQGKPEETRLPIQDLWVVLPDGTELRLMELAEGGQAEEEAAGPEDETPPEEEP